MAERVSGQAVVMPVGQLVGPRSWGRVAAQLQLVQRVRAMATLSPLPPSLLRVTTGGARGVPQQRQQQQQWWWPHQRRRVVVVAAGGGRQRVQRSRPPNAQTTPLPAVERREGDVRVGLSVWYRPEIAPTLFPEELELHTQQQKLQYYASKYTAIHSYFSEDGPTFSVADDVVDRWAKV